MENISNLTLLKKLFNELWRDYGKQTTVVIVVILVIFVGGGINRVKKGQSFFGTSETAVERGSRLRDCAQVEDQNLSPVQQMDSGGAGVCSGFSKAEIKQVQKELGL